MQLRILLLIDDARQRSRVQRILRQVDAFIRAPKAMHAEWDTATQVLSDVLIAGRHVIPDPVNEHVQLLVKSANAPALIVLSGSDDAEELAILRAIGAEAALYTEVPDDVLGDAIKGIIEGRRRLLTQTVAARRATPRAELSDFVSASPVMQAFMKTVHRVVDSDAPLLIMGETGVGKERLARAIHHDSRRADGPFISINCGAIPENLLESHLFGHERGAFTGATKTQRGCFEMAHTGTLFLDEISEMPFHLQVKLLHVLQDYEVAPVGSEKKIPVDVRVIAATNQNIAEQVAEQRFRKDLFYRLSVVSLDVPPLRERKSDIPALVSSVLEGVSVRLGRGEGGSIAPEALAALCGYSWPGNVRELINVLERALLLCEDDTITLCDLPEEIAADAEDVEEAILPCNAELIDQWISRPLKEVRETAIERIERSYLTKLLTLTGGSIGETARRAGVEPRSLFNKMKRYGLRKEEFRSQASEVEPGARNLPARSA